MLGTKQGARSIYKPASEKMALRNLRVRR